MALYLRKPFSNINRGERSEEKSRQNNNFLWNAEAANREKASEAEAGDTVAELARQMAYFT